MTQSTCTIDECETKVHARGLCRKHYLRATRARAVAPPEPVPSEIQRFYGKLHKGSDCWEWRGGKGTKGYGQFYRFGGKQVPAHRFAYELQNGPIPEGLQIDHMCHNHGCVNPGHLRAVTPKQNQEHRLGPQSNNKSSGVRGVTRCSDRARKQWIVRIKHDGKVRYFGHYETLAEAEAVAIATRARLFTHSDAHLWDKRSGA